MLRIVSFIPLGSCICRAGASILDWVWLFVRCWEVQDSDESDSGWGWGVPGLFWVNVKVQSNLQRTKPDHEEVSVMKRSHFLFYRRTRVLRWRLDTWSPVINGCSQIWIGWRDAFRLLWQWFTPLTASEPRRRRSPASWCRNNPSAGVSGESFRSQVEMIN